MCGHVGIAGKLEYKDEATFKRLLLLDYFRGPDSTGVAVVNKEGNDVKIAKIASHPLDLFDTKRFSDIVAAKAYSSGVFMGHNRAATRGKVNANNAHPFIRDHIVGCHNGTLTTSSLMALETKLEEKFDVDSEAIIAAIATFGIQETAPLLQGAWALVWFDLAQGTLNFLRNKERPFWYARTKDFGKLIWASEHPMIHAATELSGMTGDKKDYELYQSREGYQFWATELDTHYRWSLEDLQRADGTEVKPSVVIRKGKEPAAVVVHNTYQQAPFSRQTPSTPARSGTTSTTTARSDSVHSNVVHLTSNVSGTMGGYITVEEFEKRYGSYGCSWCKSELDLSRGFVVIEKSKHVLCHRCSANEQESRFYVNNLQIPRALAAN